MPNPEGCDIDEALKRPVSATLARQLCQRILQTVASVDKNASITSVARWDHDSATLVRIRTVNDNPFPIMDALKRMWPLAIVSMVENVVEGVTETQILVPSREEQHSLAREQAIKAPAVQRLRTLTRCIALAALLSFAVLVTANATR